jgi:hypothetical protein
MEEGVKLSKIVTSALMLFMMVCLDNWMLAPSAEGSYTKRESAFGGGGGGGLVGISLVRVLLSRVGTRNRSRRCNKEGVGVGGWGGEGDFWFPP